MIERRKKNLKSQTNEGQKKEKENTMKVVKRQGDVIKTEKEKRNNIRKSLGEKQSKRKVERRKRRKMERKLKVKLQLLNDR